MTNDRGQADPNPLFIVAFLAVPVIAWSVGSAYLIDRWQVDAYLAVMVVAVVIIGGIHGLTRLVERRRNGSEGAT